MHSFIDRLSYREEQSPSADTLSITCTGGHCVRIAAVCATTTGGVTRGRCCCFRNAEPTQSRQGHYHLHLREF